PSAGRPRRPPPARTPAPAPARPVSTRGSRGFGHWSLALAVRLPPHDPYRLLGRVVPAALPHLQNLHPRGQDADHLTALHQRPVPPLPFHVVQRRQDQPIKNRTDPGPHHVLPELLDLKIGRAHV